MLQYTGLWPRAEELDRVTFGFNITHRQGTRLRDIMQTGKRVVLRAQVKGIGLEPYFMDVVVAVLKGSKREAEEIVMTAHLDHPKESANDNASGSGGMLDIAATLKPDGRGSPRSTRRAIRFLWSRVERVHAYRRSPSLWDRTSAVGTTTNLDMIARTRAAPLRA
jgi:hypothetical protein